MQRPSSTHKKQEVARPISAATAPGMHVPVPGWQFHKNSVLCPPSNTNMISISARRLQSAEQFAIEVAPKHDFYRSDAVGEITPPWPTAQHMLL